MKNDTESTADPDWALADSISDQITDILNREISNRANPGDLLAGLLLGLCGFMRTADGLAKPDEFLELERVVKQCLNALIRMKQAKAKGVRRPS